MKKQEIVKQGAPGYVLVAALMGLIMMFIASSAAAEPATMCAQVKIEIRQELTLERQAFDAHMRITNGLTHLTLEDVGIVVEFSDEEGNSVSASSNPDDQDALFFIRLDSMENISAVDGTGTVDPGAVADIHWLVIPAPGAANGVPQGTMYYVGAALTYRIGGEAQLTEVSPDYIFVKPMPEFVMDYFVPSEVYGDDAFTPAIEAPVPFTLGVRVRNCGAGIGKAMKIDSAQPTIIENELGLLIGFVIEGCAVNGRAATPTLLADLGDIYPNTAATARWIMTCSLSGQFVEFTADYSHADELGGELTSLLQDVATHFLVRDVLADLAGRDTIRDFLARDGGVYRLYESDNVDTEVTDHSAASTLSGSGAVYTLSTPVTAGFIYVKRPDPFAGQRAIKTVLRSDGKRIKAENTWLSKTRNGTGWDYWYNLFDAHTTGSYTVSFETPPDEEDAPVLQFIPDRSVAEGEQLSFIVEASDPDGTIPFLDAEPLPASASFIDEGNGTGIFDWTPAVGQTGEYNITFRASDGILEDTQEVTITVCSAIDSDGDGLPDAWEMQYFGTLARDGSGDYDNDGIADGDEYINGTDPTLADKAPAPPVPHSPADNAEVTALQPDLTVVNSSETAEGPTTYEFEVYADADMIVPAASAYAVEEGSEMTAWTVSVELQENTWYLWRARAVNRSSRSLWAYGRFFVNTANDAPEPFTISSPAHTTEVDTVKPTLEVTNSIDRDGDLLTYAFEVYADSGMSTMVASASEVAAGQGGSTSWTVDTALNENTTYYWRAFAVDEDGRLGGSMVGGADSGDADKKGSGDDDRATAETPLAEFTVNTENRAPGVPGVASPTPGSEIDATEIDLVAANAVDPENDTLTYFFEVDTVDTFDSPAKQSSGEISEGVGVTDWHVGGLSENTRFYWRVKAGDGSAESGWSRGSFFVNTTNEEPTAPTLMNPTDDAWVDTPVPVFEVTAARDPDNDGVTYEFEIYSDPALTTLVAEETADTPGFILTNPLTDITWYFWQARAVDGHGLPGPWSERGAFFLKDDGVDDPPEIVLLHPSAPIAVNPAGSGSVFIAWEDDDPDSNAEIALYYDTDLSGEDGILIAEGLPEDFDGDGDAYIWDISTMDDGTYYIYAVISDTTSSVSDYGEASITIDTTPPSVSAEPPGGTYSSAQSVEVSADEPGWIYYTTDGSEPTTGSLLYSAPIGIAETTILKFMAMDALGNRSATVTEVYVFDSARPSLVILEPSGDIFTNAEAVGISWEDADDDDNAVVALFYDTDAEGNDGVMIVSGIEEDADEESDTYLWHIGGLDEGAYYIYGSITDDQETVLSPYAAGAVIIDRTAPVPEASPQGGLYTTPQSVVLSANEPAHLYYTLDGTEPTAASSLYDNPIMVEANTTIRFMAVDAAGNQSGVSIADYIIQEEVQDISIIVRTDKARKLIGVKVYAFTATGSYTGKYALTDADGIAHFDPADFGGGEYRFRVDYAGNQFWSEVFNITGAGAMVVTIPEEAVEVTVVTGSGPGAGVRVYLFSEAGSYLSQYETTDEAGTVSFVLPEGRSFAFRADMFGNQYWSDLITVSEGAVNTVTVDVGGGIFGVTVQEGDETPIAGIGVYLFSASGSYLGCSQVTDSSGSAAFEVSEGDYTVRADYRGYQFWTDPTLVTIDTTIPLTIVHQDVTVTVRGVFQETVTPVESIPVYLFSSTGSYLGVNLQTNASGEAVFHLPEKGYKVRADYRGQQFWSADFTAEDVSIDIPLADAGITVTGAGLPREGVSVYAFTETGSYLGLHEVTDLDGTVLFRLPEGTYTFRADYQGNRFWSPVVTLTAHQVNPINVSTGGGAFSLNVTTDGTEPIAGVNCYVFGAGGSYLGLFGATDATGHATFDLADGTYQFRIDYLGYQFWSEVVTVPAASAADVVIPEEAVEVTVVTGSGPAAGVRVYLFSEAGSYLSQYETTDEAGTVSFVLPEGRSFAFRADMFGNQYWSDVITVSGGGVTTVTVDVGGGIFGITVQEGDETPIGGIGVYLFSASGSYLGCSQVTDSSGSAVFEVSEGNYTVRADYGGYQFWTDPTLVSIDTTIPLTIAHQDVTVTVRGVFQETVTPVENIPVYLFSSTGTYLGVNFQTNASGEAVFHLPEKGYKVRADYRGQQFWSADFTAEDVSIDIPLADAGITVTGAGLPREGVSVYAFTETGSYLGLHEVTDLDGTVLFRLPEGTYTFRADYQGNRFWSPVVMLTAHQVNPVVISVGGGSFTVTVLKNPAEPLPGARCYAFSGGGSYLGLFGATDATGHGTFDLADGTYQFRIDYLGYQFWSEVVTVPDSLELSHSIMHSDVTVTVQGVLGDNGEARSAVPVYLFTPAGSYLGRREVTDAAGEAHFSLPAGPYTVRADYCGGRFWSGEFTGQDSAVSIPEGTARVHVLRAGEDVEGATVYLFSEENSYLSVNGISDGAGIVSFRVPAGTYRFRADFLGNQYWTTVPITEDIENAVEIDVGGGEFVLTLETGHGPLVDTRVYLFNPAGSYLGMCRNSDENGRVSFGLADGSYRFRVDHLGYQFWTGVFDVPAVLSDEFTINHQDVTVTVEKTYQSATPLPDVGVYLFTAAGSYLGQWRITDGNGEGVFTLPGESYQVRVDYVGEHFWSEEFCSQDVTVSINHGLVNVHVHRSGADLEGAAVYLFSESGSYLGWFEVTDSSGLACFELPDRSFTFRVDEGGDRVWSGLVAVMPGVVNGVEIDLE